MRIETMYEIISQVPFRSSKDGGMPWAIGIDEAFRPSQKSNDRSAVTTSHELIARPQVAELAEWQKKKVVRFIDENIDARLKVDELGKLVNLSVSRFSKGFKASFGRSPHTYILSKRIEVAKHLISATDQSLCQIAQSCGMSDQSHLSKIFKQHVGLTPMGWRRARAASRTRQPGLRSLSAIA